MKGSKKEQHLDRFIGPVEDMNDVASTQAEALVLYPTEGSPGQITTNVNPFESSNQALCLDNFFLGVVPRPPTDSHFLTLQLLRSHEAFSQIATMLQIQCTDNIGIHITSSSLLPHTLAPTSEQQTIPHRVYVDILPWPSLRRNLLTALDTVNEHEFTLDLASPNQLWVWGSTPWDPMGWEVGDAFLAKWWFLLDASILEVTNYWRSQRGEKPLSFARR